MSTLQFDANIIYAFIILIFSIFLGFIFIYNGIKDGLIKKDIIGDYQGNYLKGKRAMHRGLFFIFLGTFSLSGSVIICIFLFKNFYGG